MVCSFFLFIYSYRYCLKLLKVPRRTQELSYRHGHTSLPRGQTVNALINNSKEGESSKRDRTMKCQEKKRKGKKKKETRLLLAPGPSPPQSYPPAEMHNVLPDGLRHLPIAGVHVGQCLGPCLWARHRQVYRVACLDMAREHDSRQCWQVRSRPGIV